MKYFYQLGEYTRETKNPNFQHCQWDVRSWRLLPKFKEITKEQYKLICKEDKRVVEKYKTRYNLTIDTFHNPHKTT